MPDRYAIRGRVATLDAHFTEFADGIVFIDGRVIRAVRAATDPPPPGFEDAPRLTTGGTIYPGLIELHNHLSYNILPLWRVPRLYQHRGQWASAVAKRQFISGPMQLLAEQPGYVEAIVRYVECKCLVSGVTTTQGLTLSSAPGIERHYRGVVRNVEATDGPTMPAAGHRIADVADATAFLKALRRENSCYFLHLSEGVAGTDGAGLARQQFLNLRIATDRWAITSVLAGIHATGLQAEDFAVLADNGGAMVWSPFSNLLLYGATADVKAARDHGVPIALGADWSPTGSKNLLGELKVARLVSAAQGDIFSDRDLVSMATIGAARILKWDAAVGSLEAGKRADLLVVDHHADNAYTTLLTASEAAVSLVMIDGVPRYGLASHLDALGVTGEVWMLAGRPRRLNLADSAGDPVVGDLSLATATDRLIAGMAALPTPPVITRAPSGATAMDGRARRWRLVLDNDDRAGRAQRPLAPVTTAEVIAGFWAASMPLSELVTPMTLDELTVAEAPATFFGRLADQPNVPSTIKDELPALYQS